MRFRLLALCALALISCSSPPDASNLACNTIEGVEQVLTAPGVFIGDMHGTQESPAFLRDLSCHVMKSGKSLLVAMEYAASDQTVLDTFLQTTDEQQASRLLTSTGHWTRNIDGRASPAMRDALLAIRRYAHAGGMVRLLAYDLKPAPGQERDKASAEHLSRERAKGGNGVYWIVFGGNVHARKIKGPPMAGYENHGTLGYQIRDWNLIHLNVNYRGGSGWGCVGPDPKKDCSVIQFGPSCTTDCPAHPVIRLERGRPDDAYDGSYDVGKLTASAPLHLESSHAR
jgi:hypothetical protein